MAVAAAALALFPALHWARDSAPPIVFEDGLERSGITFRMLNSFSPQKHQVETMLAGVAVFGVRHLLNATQRPLPVRRAIAHLRMSDMLPSPLMSSWPTAMIDGIMAAVIAAGRTRMNSRVLPFMTAAGCKVVTQPFPAGVELNHVGSILCGNAGVLRGDFPAGADPQRGVERS